jgi:hypothetical protein
MLQHAWVVANASTLNAASDGERVLVSNLPIPAAHPLLPFEMNRVTKQGFFPKVGAPPPVAYGVMAFVIHPVK